MWSVEDGNKLFTILCDLKAAGNTKTDWKRILDIFNAQSNSKKSKVQAKNYIGTCKEKYVAWVEMNKMSGIAFENGLPVEAEFGLERMQTFIQKYTYGSFVTKNQLPDLPLWDQYFGGKYASGSNSCSPALAKALTISRNLKRKERETHIEDIEEGSGDSDDPICVEIRSEQAESSAKSTGSISVGKLKLGESGKFEKKMLKLNDILNRQTDDLFIAVTGMEEAKKRAASSIQKKGVVELGLNISRGGYEDSLSNRVN